MAFSRNLWKSKGNTYNEGVTVAGRFAGGGAATSMTKVTDTAGGITSVVYTGTGLYTITFGNVGYALQSYQFTCLSTTRQLVVVAVAISLTAKTITISVSDAATPTLVDLATTEELSICAIFSDSSKPNG
jgi:hypothetical protein